MSPPGPQLELGVFPNENSKEGENRVDISKNEMKTRSEKLWDIEIRMALLASIVEKTYLQQDIKI